MQKAKACPCRGSAPLYQTPSASESVGTDQLFGVFFCHSLILTPLMMSYSTLVFPEKFCRYIHARMEILLQYLLWSEL